MRPRLGLMLGTLAASLACEDQSFREIGADINVVSKRSDSLVLPATDRLRRRGRQAIPQIEIALHTASDNGRRQLVTALRAIGDAEAVPILRHFAVYDLSADVRALCEQVLAEWAKAGDERAQRAGAAITAVRDLRARGEAPAIPRPVAPNVKPI
ncbi:MAG TPA: hypothetical protein VGG33_25770 [Polyangia bacterium]